MRKHHLVAPSILALAALASEAAASSITLKQCVFTIGGICPVETILGGALVVALLFFAGFPLRYVLRKRWEARSAKDPAFRPSGVEQFLHEHAGKLTIALIAWIVIAPVLGRY